MSALHPTGQNDAAAISGADVKDPVCGMTVYPQVRVHHTDQDGEHYHFCSSGCRAKFFANPAKCLGDQLGPALEAGCPK